MMDTTSKLTKATSRKHKSSAIAIALICVLIVSVTAFTAAFYLTQVNNEIQGKLTDLGRQLTVIENQSFNAHLGDATAFDQLSSSEQAISNSLQALMQTSIRENEAVVAFASKWSDSKKYITQLLEAEQTIRMSKELTKKMDAIFPAIESGIELLVAELIGLDVAPNLVFLASSQSSLLQAMRTNLHQLNNKQQDATKILTLIKSDSEIFSSALDKIANGDPAQDIKAVRNVDVKASIQTLKNEFGKIEEISSRMVELMVRLNVSKNTYNKLQDLTQTLFDESNTLATSFKQENNLNNVALSIGYLLSIVCIVLAGTLLFPKAEETNIKAFIPDAKEDTSDKAIEQLESEIAPIAHGDLTVIASVIPGPTESIASSINYSIHALRTLINNIIQTSIAVHNTAEEAQATAMHLSFASEKQAKQITTVTNAIHKIVVLFQSMQKHANESAELASNAMTLAENGNLSVKATISSMRTIDNDIHETSSRIKRLGESSQEIGDIVQLINDIAEQTNLLALNAAIKASTSSNVNNFSSVADEIQQLAERVTQATQKIESLVTSIQLDTNQAVQAMEQSSTDVTNGTRLAEAAGNALLRIESVSAHLAQFINDVANEASNLNKNAVKISDTMSNIKKFTEQNLVATKQTASLNGKLAILAKNQKEAIDGFKLPGKSDTE